MATQIKQSGAGPSTLKYLAICRYANAAVLLVIAVLVFFVPAVTVLLELRDPKIRSAEIPRLAWKLHRNLTPKYERWATQRLDSSRATTLSTKNISGTEWPLFGSVFYLWATESLQAAWEKDHHLAATAPKIYAREAVVAATRLVIDPNQAAWVKKHWGENYLKTENVFYRMLVIAALTSHARLTEDKQYLPLLKDQVESLSAELNATSHGWLEDYPGECYPGDVLTAIAMIRRADPILGTDHSAFAQRALRGFQGRALDERGLVPYLGNANIGQPLGPARGCANSYVSLFAPELWPVQAKRWYEQYTRYFWQEAWTAAGFREFPRDLPGYDWHMDVDAGPVIKGFGFASCAFGVGAARVNGHLEHAYPLTTEMYAACWPLPNGTLLLPRFLSNAADAPYLGESGILFNLTCLPAPGTALKLGGSIPGLTWIILALLVGLGLALVIGSIRSCRHWRKNQAAIVVRAPRLHFACWLGLVLASVCLLVLGHALFALCSLLCTQLIPRYRVEEPDEWDSAPQPAECRR